MAYWRLPQALGCDYSIDAIKGPFRRAGFKRYIARRKPPIIELMHQKRLGFAERYINWSLDDCKAILWSDVKGKDHDHRE
jgi:hypothetical protein